MINTDFKSIIELLKTFPDEQTCINHLTELRWNGNIVSPFDPTSKIYVCKDNKFRCKNTGKYFNVRTATLFDNTKIELRKWFLAIYIVTSHKKGISSMQLAKDIDVTQKTAWFMLQRIRNCFGFDKSDKSDNMVEIDETYVGGENKNRSISKRAELHENGKQTGMNDKTPVLGILERDGNVKGFVLDRAYGNTIKPILKQNINSSAVVITDGFGAYTGISKSFSKHVVVNHHLNEYSVGEFSTNHIENFWSLLKRGIFGIYHFTSPKHLQKYVNEFAFRYNTRDLLTCSRFNTMLRNTEYRLTYNDLIK
jgi:transposase-like protein